MELATVKSELLRDLSRLLRPDQVSASPPDRLSYGRDSCSKGILWVRDNQVKFPPEAVVWPESAREVAKVLAFASERGVPVVPFGGGSGVCGGTWALRGGISLDLKRLNRILKVDGGRMTVRAQAGINGELLERELKRRNLTLGHFPSSIYVATLGGYLACRSAGQFSSLYGKIEDMVEAMQVVLADGRIVELADVADCPGELDLKELFLGSEGTLGVVTEATLRVHPQPESETFLGFTFARLDQGLEAIRKILQAGLKPAVVRLYDELDTQLFSSYKQEAAEPSVLEGLAQMLNPVLHWAKDASLKLALKRPALLRQAMRLLPAQCMLILGFQGAAELTQAQVARARELCVELKAKDLGEGPGRYWLKHRYSVSYKLSPLFDAGLFADTMEVATTWNNLRNLYDRVRAAISRHGLVMAHFSHAYPEGCSIYFTFLGFRDGGEASRELYDRIWAEALKACVAAGGTITHHHGVGVLKAAFMKDEWGEAMDWLNRMKRKLDPAGILNPGKLGFSHD